MVLFPALNYILCVYFVSGFYQTAVLEQTNDGVYGAWGTSSYCNSGEFARGFKLKVEGTQGGNDDTSANAIRFYCAAEADSTSYNEITINNEGAYGSWASQVTCPSGTFIIGFDQKVEGIQGGGDDTTLNSVKAKCSDGSYIESSNAGPYGSFTGNYVDCPAYSYICGFNQQVEPTQGGGDDTSLNAVKLFCCSYNYFMESGVSGNNNYYQTDTLEQSNDGNYGSWGSPVYCPAGEFARGFKLRVESNQGGGDDTAGNAFRLNCAASASSTSYTELISTNEASWGGWSSQSCNTGYFITGFDQKVEGIQGGGDDTTLNSVRVKCSTGGTTEASNGGPWGDWNNNYKECTSGSYVCGFKQKVESDQSGGDDTALNAIKLYCCRQNSVTISKKTWSDANSFCKAKYGTVLATVNSDGKAKEILRLRELNSDLNGRFWIGLNDLNNEGHWQWADGTDCGGASCDASKLSYWNSGEPNNSGNEDCGEISSGTSSSNLDNLFNDLKCSNSFAFACNAAKYFFVNDLKNWRDANEYCASQYGTQLATITSDEDVEEILRLRNLYGVSSATLWIGLNDLFSEGYWQWADGTDCGGASCDDSALSYWNSGEPNNSGNEDCAEIRGGTSSSNLGNLFNDNQCYHSRKFVCNAPSSGIVADNTADLWSCFDSGARGSSPQMDGYKYCGCSDGEGVLGIYRSGCNSLYCIEEMECGQPKEGTADCYNEDVHSTFDSAGTVSCNTDYILSGFLLNPNGNCQNLYCIEKLRCCKWSGYEWDGQYENDWSASFDNAGWHYVAPNQYITAIERSNTNDLIGIEKVISRNLRTANEIKAYQHGLAVKYAPILKFSGSHAEGYPASAAQTQTYYDVNVAPDPQTTNYLLDNNDLTQSETFWRISSCEDGIKIEYRWFYGYQHECNTIENSDGSMSGEHWADWERIIVHLNSGGDYLEKVSFFQHGHYYTLVDGQFYKEDTHPIVYIGAVAHGAYYDYNDYYVGFSSIVSSCGYYYDYRKPYADSDTFRTYESNLYYLFDQDWSSTTKGWDTKWGGIAKDFDEDICPDTIASCSSTGCYWYYCDTTSDLQLHLGTCMDGAIAPAKTNNHIIDINDDIIHDHGIITNNNNNNIYYILFGLFILVSITTILNIYCYSKTNKSKTIETLIL